jgi:hypothetical protein
MDIKVLNLIKEEEIEKINEKIDEKEEKDEEIENNLDTIYNYNDDNDVIYQNIEKNPY